MNFYTLDYETRSKADLKKVGVHKYAEHPSTRILLAAISKNGGEPHLWVNPLFATADFCSDPRAMELLTEATSDPEAIIYAHNAEFERAISNARMLSDIGLLAPERSQWRCTAAMARRAGLPAKLESLAKVLGGTQKDVRGKTLVKKFSIPNKTGEFNDPRAPQHQLAFKQFGSYCKTDCVAEDEVKVKLQAFELTGGALGTFLLDSYLNDNGLPVNVQALKNAEAILQEVWAEKSNEFYELTGLMPTQKMAVKDLLHEMGVDVEDMKGDTLKAAIALTVERLNAAGEDGCLDEVPHWEHQLKVLQLYADLNYAAAKKVISMLACVCEDGRIRGTLLYHGAGTGRWTGQKVQPQNFKKPTIKNTHLAYEMICQGCSRAELEMVFGNALEVIASCIRHFIQWPEGDILDADYNAIEARIVCWLAGQEDVLEIFRQADTWTGDPAFKPDLYKNMAGRIYNRAPHTIINPSHERTVGKHTVLGCGFGMWWPKFIDTCAKFKVTVDKELAKKSVLAYREMCDKVVELWHTVEQAAKNAILYPGKTFTAGKLVFAVAKSHGIPYLVMRLPSGRNIVYPFPLIEPVKYLVTDEDGNAVLDEHGMKVYKVRQSITYYGQLEGKQIWGRIKTYGGSLVENATQGVAADVMSCGSQEAIRRLFELLTLVHDQALAAHKAGQTVDEFCNALTTLPDWAAGLPIKAEGRVVPFYTKS